jgi:hypothetical protein
LINFFYITLINIMKNTISQGLVLTMLILVIPWLWTSTMALVNFKFYYPLLYLIPALLMNAVFLRKCIFLSLKLIVISIVLIPFSMELMHFISFEIHWVKNDIHYTDPSTGVIEMYRDFDSFFVFSYSDGNWHYRFVQSLYNMLAWLLPFGFFFVLRFNSEKGKMNRKKEF